jgi:hypothetical protein
VMKAWCWQHNVLSCGAPVSARPFRERPDLASKARGDQVTPRRRRGSIPRPDASEYHPE